MSAIHPKVLLVCNSNIYKNYISPNEVKRLEKFASWDWFNLDHANIDAQLPKSFFEAIEDVDALVISHGSPLIGAEIMDSATRLRFIGELEDAGDELVAEYKAYEKGRKTYQGGSFIGRLIRAVIKFINRWTSSKEKLDVLIKKQESMNKKLQEDHGTDS